MDWISVHGLNGYDREITIPMGTNWFWYELACIRVEMGTTYTTVTNVHTIFTQSVTGKHWNVNTELTGNGVPRSLQREQLPAYEHNKKEFKGTTKVHF